MTRLSYDRKFFEITRFLVKSKDAQMSDATPLTVACREKEFDCDGLFAAVDYLISLNQGFIVMETAQMYMSDPSRALNTILEKEHNSVTCTELFHKLIISWSNDLDNDIR
ncbi:MAG: hypothetical protein JWP69_1899 [Flaviaesturariibacter sp.]|nr:hypothetical protein [Flaviaesturariibacter sp.]